MVDSRKWTQQHLDAADLIQGKNTISSLTPPRENDYSNGVDPRGPGELLDDVTSI